MRMVVLVFSVIAFFLGSCALDEKAAVGEKAWKRVGEMGYVLFVLVNKSDETNLAVYEDAIRSLCLPDFFCSLRFWSDKAEVPTSLPMTIAQSEAITAEYLHNPGVIHERFRWNCLINKEANCFSY